MPAATNGNGAGGAHADPVTSTTSTVYGVPANRSRGQQVLHPSREGYLPLVRALVTDGFTFCSDLCAVDHLANPARTLPPEVVPERFEVVVNLLRMADHRRVRLRVQVPGDDPTVPSLFSFYPGVEAMEREAFDLFGVRFTDHPDLTRILLPEDWEGHPLRKDYSLGRVPVQFKAPPGPR